MKVMLKIGARYEQIALDFDGFHPVVELMAVVDGYAMVRRPGRVPFVLTAKTFATKYKLKEEKEAKGGRVRHGS